MQQRTPMPMGDLFIRAACLPQDDRLADVLVHGGQIAAIGAGLVAPEGVAILDAGGRALIPGLVDSHLHLDKALFGERWIPVPPARDLAERIAMADRVMAEETRRTLRERATAMLRTVLPLGTTALRSHIDIDPGVGLASVETLLALRAEYAGLVEIDLVAFPQHGILRSPGTAELLDAALGLGVPNIGGLDPAGYDGDVEAHLGIVFGLAMKHGAGIDIHLHDGGTEGATEIARICELTVANGLQGKVAISHALAIGDLSSLEAGRLIERLLEAGITIVTSGPGARDLPRVPSLWSAGVPVAFGCDNVHDAWWPWGRGDMLERAFLVGYRSGLRTDNDLRHLLDSATIAGAKLLGLGEYGVAVGARADLVLVDAECAPEAVAAHPAGRTVIKGGRIVARDGRLVDGL